MATNSLPTQAHKRNNDFRPTHQQRITAIRNTGGQVIEYATEITVWLMPIVAAISLYSEITHRPVSLVSTVAGGWIAAVAVELCALSFMHTALSLFNKKRFVAFGFMIAAITVYIITIGVLTLGHFLWPELARTLTPIGLSVIALLSALTASFRANYLSQIDYPKVNRKTKTRANGPVKKRPTDQSPEDRQANLDHANRARRPTQDDYDQAKNLRDSGLTWSQVAAELDVSQSTAKRWSNLAKPPVHLNGHGE